MIYDTPGAGLAAIMFPVKEMKVFADTGPDCLARAPAYKAIVNADSNGVVSIVGRQYRVLLNRDAFDLARWACSVAFPNTEPQEWEATTVEAPLSGGSCTVDLGHERAGRVLSYDWAPAPGRIDPFVPFIRFRNGYNGRTAFSFFFGFERMACGNRIIEDAAISGFRVSHDTKDVAEQIQREIQNANLPAVADRFLRRVTALWGVPVPRHLFRPIVQGVLRIRPPKKASNGGQQAWEDLWAFIDQVSNQYIEEFDATAYALMNTISDLATHLPSHPLGHALIRRGRHSLQRLAAHWLGDFSDRVIQPDFDVSAYFRRLLRESERR